MVNPCAYWVCGFASQSPELAGSQSPMETGFAGLRSLRTPQGRFKSLAAFVWQPRDPMIFLRFQN